MGEGEPAEEPPSLEGMPQLSLEIFNLIKSSHAQHGLRHGDYVRYRQYCTRRLHRLRKAVGLMQGKGRFQRRTLEPHMVKEEKHLMLPLYMAERAWSYAMALKRENTSAEPRPRFHLQHRLNKAAKWSAELKALCSTRAWNERKTGVPVRRRVGTVGQVMNTISEELRPTSTRALRPSRTSSARIATR